MTTKYLAIESGERSAGQISYEKEGVMACFAASGSRKLKSTLVCVLFTLFAPGFQGFRIGNRLGSGALGAGLLPGSRTRGNGLCGAAGCEIKCGLVLGFLGRRVRPGVARHEGRWCLDMKGEGAEDLQDLQANDDLGFSDYISQVPERLMHLVLHGDVASEDGRQEARKNIIELEQLKNFPFDPSFFSLCVSGEWDLVYSTSRVLTPDSNLKIREITSVIDGGSRKLVHRVGWEFVEEAVGEDVARETKGVFEVKMAYNLSEVPSVPTRMIVGIEEMRLTCSPVNKTPRDPQALISSVQRGIPKEFFDPDESLMDTTYLDPNMRIVCFLGMRFAGVRHVYRRRNPLELSVALQEGLMGDEEDLDEIPDWLVDED